MLTDVLDEINRFVYLVLRNASWLEIAWSVGACLGIYFGSRACKRAWPQLRRLWPRRHRERPIFDRAVKRFRDAFGVVLRHVGWLTIGIATMVIPPAPPREDDTALVGILAAVVFLGFEFYDIVMLWWDERDWNHTVVAFMKDPSLILKLVESDTEERLDVATHIGRDMGHYINNQLTLAMGSIDLLLQDSNLSEDLRLELNELSAILDGASNRVGELHQQLKELSPKEADNGSNGTAGLSRAIDQSEASPDSLGDRVGPGRMGQR